MFKRRDPRTFWASFKDTVWPEKGWMRPINYIRYRIQRLPDSPERIGRGVAAGVMVSFSPFIGLHFFLALGLAKLMRGNLIGSVIGSWIGNPVTAIPIGLLVLNTGYAILGIEPEEGLIQEFPKHFADAGLEIWHNIGAAFGPKVARWEQLSEFWDLIFFPYLVGCLVPMAVMGLLSYLGSVYLVRAYQKLRHQRLLKRQEKLAAREKGKTPDAT